MTDHDEPTRPSVRREGGMAVIRIPMKDLHGWRVALNPCPCKAAKSSETDQMRMSLVKALGRLQR